MRDFSDLIRILHDILIAEPDGGLARALRRQYQVVLVDEFQDTDRMQWDIFHTLFGRDEDHNYFLIGDPKQSIYGFRGADLSVYFQACETVDERRRYSLGTNYRSRKALVDSCNYLFSRLFALPVEGSRSIPFQEAASGTVKGAVPRDRRGAVLPAMNFCEIKTPDEKPIVSKTELKRAWMADIAARIKQLLNDKMTLTVKSESRPVQPGDLAVLMDTNRDCEAMQAELEGRGISSVIYSDRRVLDTPEAELFGLFLKSLANPADRSALAALLISPVFNLTAAALKDLELSDRFDQVRLLFQQWKSRMDRGGLIRVFHELFEGEALLGSAGEEVSWKNRLLSQGRGDRSCTNLIHLAELFHQEQRARSLDARGLHDHFVRMKNDSRPDDLRQVRLDKDGEAVQILTHHSSKGLEYPVVFFCGGLQDGSVGSSRSELTYYWDKRRYRDYLLSAESRKKAALSDWVERQRLYYVSFTRASSLLYLPVFPQADFCYLTNLYAALCGDKLIREAEGLIQNLPLEEQWPFHTQLKWCKNSDIKKKKASVNDKIASLLEDISRENPELFGYFRQELSDGNLLLFPDESEEELLPPQELHAARWQPGDPFYRRITSVESFSSLTAGAHGQRTEAVPSEPESDADRDARVSAEPGQEELSGPLGLTRGADFGNLVHYLFENLDYSRGETSPLELEDQRILLEEASLLFFDQTWWQQNQKALGELVWNVLNCPLNGTTALKNIPAEDRKHELEFLFRIPEASRIVMEEWTVPVEKGYLKGFIDMIFRFDEKIYIADWKTTVPDGRGEAADYDAEKLSRTMHKHLYDVQAMIYVQALRRYLKILDPEFSYERGFGGVYYFFVRGMGPEGSRGVHFSRPGEDQLEEFLKGGIDYA